MSPGMPDLRGSANFRVFWNILGHSYDLSRSKENIFFVYRGEGGL